MFANSASPPVFARLGIPWAIKLHMIAFHAQLCTRSKNDRPSETCSMVCCTRRMNANAAKEARERTRVIEKEGERGKIHDKRACAHNEPLATRHTNPSIDGEHTDAGEKDPPTDSTYSRSLGSHAYQFIITHHSDSMKSAKISFIVRVCRRKHTASMRYERLIERLSASELASLSYHVHHASHFQVVGVHRTRSLCI